MFQLDPQLAQDTLPVGRFPLSLLLLSKDANYPWCILVPQRADVFEIHHLSGEDQQQLIHESSLLSETMTSLFDAYKMNIAALGNQVPQLHIHIIARYATDAAWPNPVWNSGVASTAYTSDALQSIMQTLKNTLIGGQ